MNGQFFRHVAAPMIKHLQYFLCGERAQRENRIHRMGSFRTLAAFAHLVIYSAVNVWLSLWEGMADRRIQHANTKLTGHSRPSARLE